MTVKPGPCELCESNATAFTQEGDQKLIYCESCNTTYALPRLFTVQIAIPYSDPAWEQSYLQKMLQALYDQSGMAGSFKITNSEEYSGDPAMFCETQKKATQNG